MNDIPYSGFICLTKVHGQRVSVCARVWYQRYWYATRSSITTHQGGVFVGVWGDAVCVVVWFASSHTSSHTSSLVLSLLCAASGVVRRGGFSVSRQKMKRGNSTHTHSVFSLHFSSCVISLLQGQQRHDKDRNLSLNDKITHCR
jgi:hypothetical protein